MRLATNTAMAVAPKVISDEPSEQARPRRALRRQIGDRHSSQPRLPTGTDTTSGARQPSRETVTGKIEAARGERVAQVPR